MADWVIEPLAADHERGEFSCGKPPLDRFIKEQAGQYQRRGIGKTCVAVIRGSRRVVGYHTLAAGQIAFQDLPKDIAKRTFGHPLPVILLGRLAVDQSHQGVGLGVGLLVDALRRSVQGAEVVGAAAVFVEAIDDPAAAFYAKFGFVPLPTQPRRLFLPMQTARALGKA